MLFIFPIVTVLLYAAVKGDLHPDRLRAWARSNEWLLLFLAGLAQLPGALLARTKAGGDINSLSFALYYFNAAACLIFARVLGAGRGSRDSHSVSVPQAAVWAVTILAALIEGPTAMGIPNAIRELPDSEQQVAYRYITHHPGKAFFIWFTLSHVLAEGKLYHSGFGVAEREMAGNRVSDQHFRAGIPPNPEILAYKTEGVGVLDACDFRSYLPEFSVGPPVAELPGWSIFTKRMPGSAR
jgi:hypothetical protein